MADVLKFLSPVAQGDDMVLLSRQEYERLTADAEDIGDIALADEAIGGPCITHEDVEAIFAGQLHPLTAWRKAAGLSQDELARKSRTRQATISDIENGKLDPRLSTIVAIARALDVEVENLIPHDVEEESIDTKN